jgi:hypothetical protein
MRESSPVVSGQRGPVHKASINSVTVTWNGDNPSTVSGQVTGSGVAAYDLEVRIDNGAWERLLTNTQSTSYQYPGQYGQYLPLVVMAYDAAGHETDANAVINVTVDTSPPAADGHSAGRGSTVADQPPEGAG